MIKRLYKINSAKHSTNMKINLNKTLILRHNLYKIKSKLMINKQINNKIKITLNNGN